MMHESSLQTLTEVFSFLFFFLILKMKTGWRRFRITEKQTLSLRTLNFVSAGRTLSQCCMNLNKYFRMSERGWQSPSPSCSVQTKVVWLGHPIERSEQQSMKVDICLVNHLAIIAPGELAEWKLHAFI